MSAPIQNIFIGLAKLSRIFFCILPQSSYITYASQRPDAPQGRTSPFPDTGSPIS